MIPEIILTEMDSIFFMEITSSFNHVSVGISPFDKIHYRRKA